jgi:hypothetical protein
MAASDEVSAGQAPAAPVFDSYGRLSWNPTTRELEKIETQHGDNETTIKRHGRALGERLDDGLSAWKISVRRPGFEKLLERASTGASQGIAVWHVDRLFRQPRDLERLIDLADGGFRVISSHGCGRGEAEVAKLEFLRSMGADSLDLSGLPAERRRFLATVGRRLTAQALISARESKAERQMRDALAERGSVPGRQDLARSPELKRNLIAVLLAHSTNLGLTRMAEACGISYDVLAWTVGVVRAGGDAARGEPSDHRLPPAPASDPDLRHRHTVLIGRPTVPDTRQVGHR